jgi:alpha-galactosidase
MSPDPNCGCTPCGTPDAPWSDVILTEGAEPVITYRSGLAVYEESLSRGNFVGRGWNAAGFVNFYDGRLNPAEHPMPQAFWLEMDGQLLTWDWEWGGLEELPAAEGQKHVVVSLRHKVRPVAVKVHTVLDGTPILARWLEITNTGAQPAALSAVASWSGVLQKTNRWRGHLGESGQPLYSLGYMGNSHWGNEGDFAWHDLPVAGYRVDGRYRRDRHRHPMFVLRNNATGEHFICQLAWTGGYGFEFDLDADAGTMDQAARLFFRAGPDAPAPLRMVAPGETVKAPEVHLGAVFGDLDAAVNAMHRHMRETVFLPQPRGRGGWVESGIGPEIEITHDSVLHAIDCAGDLGVEVFFIDASWYAAPHSNWWDTVGEWQVNRERFPQGLAPFQQRARDRGMLFGLWMDAERLGDKSRIFAEHPEWLAATYAGDRNIGGLLDLTKPEVAQWMEDAISRVIADNGLDFFRLDHNTHPGPGLANARDGFTENGYWRYYDALYGVYERLRARHPNVIFENCAGGGGRTDIGMVRRFSHTWVTDWQIAPRSFTITNGMTMALPPEYVDRLLGGQSGHTMAEVDFQARLLLFCRPTIGFPKPEGAAWSPQLLARLKRFVSLYKEVARPIMSTGRIFHHTPSLPGPDPQGWGVLELASGDGSRAICGLFQLSAPARPEYLLRFRGLDAGRRFRVTFDNSGATCEVDGYVLTSQGLTVRLGGALTSELLIVEAV